MNDIIKVGDCFLHEVSESIFYNAYHKSVMLLVTDIFYGTDAKKWLRVVELKFNSYDISEIEDKVITEIPSYFVLADKKKRKRFNGMIEKAIESTMKSFCDLNERARLLNLFL